MINELSKQIHENNVKKGFYDSEKNIGEMLCLIHSEVSEALEADRKDMYSFSKINSIAGWTNDNDFVAMYKQHIKGTFDEELADIMIRVMDLAYFKGINLEANIKAKMRYNSLRPYKHGKLY